MRKMRKHGIWQDIAVLIVFCFSETSLASFNFRILPRDTPVVVGQSASLPCSATYNNRTPDVYSWERNGELLSMRSTGVNKLILSNGSIVFSSVTDAGASPDTGSYRCIAEKIGSAGKVHRIASPAVFLRSASMGEFEIQPANVDIGVGVNAMFECKTNGLPDATYTWSKDGSKLSPSNRILIHGDGEALEVKDVTSSDGGSYKCHATNIAGVLESNSASLSVQQSAGSTTSAPEFIVRPRDVSVEAGQSATLYCAVHGRGASGNKPVLTWLRQGSTINTARSGGHYELLGGGSLRINNVTAADVGKYTCRGDNSIDVSDAEATLTVLIAPYYATRPSDTIAYVNGDAELKCDVRGHPSPTVYWLKNSNYVTIDEYSRVVGGNLKTMALMPTDAGYYQCIGVNSVGSVSATAELKVLVEGTDTGGSTGGSGSTGPANNTQTLRPAPPTNLRSVLISYTYVTLTWHKSGAPDSPVNGYTVSAVALSEGARLRTASSTTTDYTMQGLQPNTVYVFKVSAYNVHGRSNDSQELRIRTFAEEAVPGPVQQVEAVPASAYSIVVTWTIPLNANGVISEYRTFYYSTDQSKEVNISSTLTSVTINNLDPYTTYHVRVVAVNDNGEGMPSEELTVRTLSARPSEAPLRVSAQPTGFYTVLLRWSPPPSRTVNGQLTGYQIKYKEKNGFSGTLSHTTDGDARSYEIGGLQSGAIYLVKVAAVNIKGPGESSEWVEVTTYSSSLEESRPPGRPIRLTIEPFSRELIITWIPANDNILVKGYKLGYGTITPDAHWKTIEASQRLDTITNLLPKTNYVVQLFAYNDAGPGLKIEQQAFTTEETVSTVEEGEVELPPLSPPHGVETRVMSSTSIIVTWTDGTLGRVQANRDGRVYTVRYQAISGSSHRRVKHADTSDFVMQLKRLKPFTEYEIAVMVTKGERSSLYSFSTTNTTLEAAPSTPPGDLTVTRSDRGLDYLYVSWQPPSQPNGRIISYIIFSNTNSSVVLEKWARDPVAGNLLNYQFGPVTTDTRYYFIIAAQTNIGSSPASPIISFKTPKGGKIGGKTTPDTAEVGVVSEAVDPTLSLLQTSPYLLWIIIACAAFVIIVIIAIFITIICLRRKRTNKQRSEAKHSQQPPDVVTKPNPPDLWIDHHERHELTGMRLQSETDNETDERTSMLQSNFDVSVSLAGDVSYHDDGRYSSLTRSGRPVIIASNPHRDATPRAAVTPMSADHSRPLYPRTQFAAGGQHGSTPRVHVGDTSQPSSDYYHHSLGGMAVGAGGGGATHSPHHLVTIPASIPSSPSSEQPTYSLRSYQKPPTPSVHVPRHIVKPQPAIAFKMGNQMTASAHQPGSPTSPMTGCDDTASPAVARRGSQRRPARQQLPQCGSPSANVNANNLSASREDLKSSMMTHSTEQLSAEMANLDCIMQDLNAIKNDFEMA